ncbi:MAG: RepB family plasmid replication protein [Oenococcus sp.]|uniref:DUF536 domain-containing protein n=1 Tax=Oenococcus TaxID=46254 RepID=UPI0021E84509|nr:RepB family plasmid replication protein [Oenococcus kitaharae]MCV3296225.1 RepB family plasmid replication protein [Oenococcus kitaharae]
MTERNYTIKELADEFGKSKQAIRNAITKGGLSVSNRKKTGKLTVLEYSEKTHSFLAKKYGEDKDSTIVDKSGQNTKQEKAADNDLASGLALNALIKQLEEVNKQLTIKDEQIKDLHTLLDQSQKLQLSEKKKPLLEDGTEKKEGFFSRLFK